MPETPEQFHARTAGALSTPPVETWDVWPFDGELRPRPLQPPVEREAPRHGEGGVDCWACETPDEAFVWTDEHWRRRRPRGAFGPPRRRAALSARALRHRLATARAGGGARPAARPDRGGGARRRRHRPGARLPLGRRLRAPALVVHGAARRGSHSSPAASPRSGTTCSRPSRRRSGARTSRSWPASSPRDRDPHAHRRRAGAARRRASPRGLRLRRAADARRRDLRHPPDR